MIKTSTMPWWVFLAFSSIETRKGALWLLWSCVLFTLYCISWVSLVTGCAWIARVFLIEDWSWFAMMLPMVLWYGLSLRWLDKHQAWDSAPTH